MEIMDEIKGYLSSEPPSPSASASQRKAAIINDMSREDDSNSSSDSDTEDDAMIEDRVAAPSAASVLMSAASNFSAQRCEFIPMRLTEHERKLLQVFENALEVCEYTDMVDVTFSHTRKSKQSRILESLVDILSISCGLLLSHNLSKGEHQIAGKTLNDNVPLFTDLFEIARRYKVMNPSKLRSTYGKLMYILMDTESYNIKSDLKITFVKPILTVHSFLKQRNALDILRDPLFSSATVTISSSPLSSSLKTTTAAMGGTAVEKGPPSSSAGSSISSSFESEQAARKKQAEQMLLKKYTSATLTEEDLRRVIDSIADNEAYLAFNKTPVDRVLRILKESFDPRQPEDPFSLKLVGQPRKLFSSFTSLYSGSSGFSSGFLGSGACLSHDHSTQFKFVQQTFTLWREVMANMPKLWLLADADMTQESYRLVDTGQGYQRLQQSPRIRREMSRILQSVQQQCGSWVGLSVVHLGDRDVPNALIFIDKYTQVPRILAPIVQCINALPSLVNDVAFHEYVSQEWGSIRGLRMQILADFFKHGFDGSGDDGGSCIDGRLTSAWNWCSKLHKKPYYHVFMFTGFQGFDGDWKENC